MDNLQEIENEISQIEKDVPYIVYEGTIARHERTVKRLIIALIVSVCLIFASNMAWLWYISGFDTMSYEYTQDGKGINIVGNENGIDYGTASQNQNPQEEEPAEG